MEENYDRAGCADRVQIDNMLPYHATNKKTAFTKNKSGRGKEETVRLNKNINFITALFSEH